MVKCSSKIKAQIMVVLEWGCPKEVGNREGRSKNCQILRTWDTRLSKTEKFFDVRGTVQMDFQKHFFGLNSI